MEGGGGFSAEGGWAEQDGENCSASGSALRASFVPLWCHLGLRCSGWHRQPAAVQEFQLKPFLPAYYAHFSTNK